MKSSDNGSSLYRRVWRWHFFAGLLVAPIAFVLAITGAIYLFTPQINAFSEARIHADDIANSRAVYRSPEQVLSDLLAQHPGYRFERLRLSRNADQSYEIDLIANNDQVQPNKLRAWVNVATGELISTNDPDSSVPEFVKRVHGELLGGKVGSLLVELVACWFIILLVTGLYLYWPRGVSWRSVLLPSLHRRGRALLLCVHGSVAAWSSVAILVFLLSGLPWTQVWGTGFKWIQDHMGVPDQGQEWRVTLQSQAPANNRSLGVGLDGAVALAQGESLLPPVYVTPPKEGGVWTVRSLHPNRANRVTIHFDQWNGEELMRIQFADKHWFKRLVSHSISLHEGHLLGPLNQVLGVLVALSVIAISVTGPLMWWRRRPTGKFAAPKAQPGHRLNRVMTTVIIALAALLPLVAASILAVLLLDFLRARISRAFIRN